MNRRATLVTLAMLAATSACSPAPQPGATTAEAGRLNARAAACEGRNHGLPQQRRWTPCQMRNAQRCDGGN